MRAVALALVMIWAGWLGLVSSLHPAPLNQMCIAAQERVTASCWRGIASAPHNDDVILVFDGDIVELATWNRRAKRWDTYGPSEKADGNPDPIQWMPIPDPQ